ncbi:hypothetical protein BGW41_003812 [Actinomortierella wolfii]|nr:hypothetical protein BGW41_003812 [Actinomortierella wolfii]
MQAKMRPLRPKRPLQESDSDETVEIEPTLQDDRLPNHDRFFSSLTTGPLIEWLLTDGNLEATENPLSSRYSLTTKAAVWLRCAEFVVGRVQTMVQNDPSLAAKAKKELDKINPPSKKDNKDKGKKEV